MRILDCDCCGCTFQEDTSRVLYALRDFSKIVRNFCSPECMRDWIAEQQLAETVY